MLVMTIQPNPKNELDRMPYPYHIDENGIVMQSCWKKLGYKKFVGFAPKSKHVIKYTHKEVLGDKSLIAKIERANLDPVFEFNYGIYASIRLKNGIKIEIEEANNA